MYQGADTIKTFEEAKDRIKGIVNNRLARGKPVPMDVGQVQDNRGNNDYEYPQDPGAWDYEVNMAGWSYGKGKDGGKGRDFGKGKGKDSQGEVEGTFCGDCWNCGENGHSA